jgi:hypothetical protein
MMRCDTFVRSALFAAVAAAGWVPWVMLSGPLVGVWTARAVYLATITAVYIAGLSPPGFLRITLALAAGLVGGVLVLAAHTTAELAIGLAAILGVARSGFLYQAALGRALAIEVPLLAAGLLLARFLAAASLPSTALALWGFLLVQSCFFLVAAARVRAVGGRHSDPFEDAYRRAVGLLERTGV